MVRALRAISDTAWDELGVAFGAVACAAIGHQGLQEWRSPGTSTVSLWFVGGFFAIYVFCFLYGVRFPRRAIWLSNAVAAILQVFVAAVVLIKG